MLAALKAAAYRRPVLANMIGTALLASASDIVCQVGVEEHRWENFDFYRTARFFVLGTTVMSFMTPWWYRFSEKHICGGNPKLLPLKKVFIHVFLYAPVNMAVQVTEMRMLEGNGPVKALKMMTERLPDVMIGYFKIYPAVQILHYYLIPVVYRHPINQPS